MKPTFKLPVATYRLQLNNGFTFDDAARISKYLSQLNISHIYLSPIFESGKGSNHGYDVIDFTKISAERGGRAQFQNLVDKINELQDPLKLIIDIVPNHMAAITENPYWNDVLANGRANFWDLFDIKIKENEKIEIPILAGSGDQDIQIVKNLNGYRLKYFENEYPLSKESLLYLEQNPSASAAEILNMQYYSLVPWTNAFHSVSYRRFFDVMGLIGLKIENENIFEQTHDALFKLLSEFPSIEGVRVDHIDGLADPKTYLERLNARVPSVWIEKILAREENLSAEWLTKGTTGYEFIDCINQLFVHKENFEIVKTFWLEVTAPEWGTSDACIFASKERVLKDLFQSELQRLIAFISKDEKEYSEARIFWTGLLCGLPVYRTYPEQNLDNNEWITKACETAGRYLGNTFLSVKDKFLSRLINPQTETEIKAAGEWQQLSGPVMAKGLEDTAHYRFTPLTALNDVGCKSEIVSSNKNEYFDWLKKRGHDWPLAMNTTSTHDTKRSEDTRHRLYALADKPEEWINFFTKAQSVNHSLKKGTVPSAATEYFLYQTILGTWPLDGIIDTAYVKRIKDYMQKADREARTETQWIEPNKEYEQNIDKFIDKVLSHEAFRDEVHNFAENLSRSGAINSLSILTLKILSAGIPDIYQGMEYWDFSLVDPDNRRPVDYDLRQKLLSNSQQLEKSGRSDFLLHLSQEWRDGSIKVWLTRELLKIRKDYLISTSFDITLLKTKGRYAENLIAYSIIPKERSRGLIIACPRYPGTMPLLSGLCLDWADTEILQDGLSGASDFRDLLNNTKIEFPRLASQILSNFPLAVLSFNKI